MDELTINRVKELFNDYIDLLDNKKTIATQISEVVEQAATALNLKKAVATKLFALMKKKKEGSEEFDTLATLLVEIEE